MITHRSVLTEKTRSFAVYCVYRFVLAVLLVILHTSGVTSMWTSDLQSGLFWIGTGLFLIIAVVGLSQQFDRLHPPSVSQITTHLVLDIVSLSLIMHAAGGLSSGIAPLLGMVVAAAGIMLAGQLALLIASLATFGLFIEVYLGPYLAGESSTREVFNAGLLGLLFFFVAVTFRYLSQRISRSQQEVERFASKVQSINQLNELIVRRLRTGLIVLSKTGEIKLINRSAKKLLGLPINGDIAIDDSPELYRHHQSYQQAPVHHSKVFIPKAGMPPIKMSFSIINNSDGDLLVFIEDVRQLNQEAQSLKQRSLGSLAANIAHEIRNPLSAIQHSAQLLSESKDLGNDDRQLTEIMVRHTDRVNRIIENVQRISRREPPQSERFDLNDWLNQWVKQFQELHGQAELEVTFDPSSANIVNVDRGQLNQVVNNLAENAIRHSEKVTGHFSLRLEVDTDENMDTPVLRIVDQGLGIPEEMRLIIFEPFHTSESTGTGLGLYIAKDLCELNQAQLSYRPTVAGESCFEILFAHPNRGQS